MAGYGAEKKRWVHTGPDIPCGFCQRNIDLDLVDIDFLYTSVFGTSTVSGPPAHPSVDHCHIEFDEDELLENADKLKVWDGGGSPLRSPFGEAIRPGNFHTLEEAQQWIKGTKNVEYNLHGIDDIDSANQILKVIERVSTKYSHVGFDLTYVHGDLIEEALNALDDMGEQWPEAMKQFKYFGTYLARDEGKVIPPDEEAVFHGFPEGAMAHAVGRKQIGLNADLWDSYDRLTAMLEEAHWRGWLASPEPRGTVYHEFGHIVQDWWIEESIGKTLVPFVPRFERTRFGISGNDMGYVSDIVDEWYKQVRPDFTLSEYALTMLQEAWAESFAVMNTRPEDEWPDYVIRLKEMIDWSLDDKHLDPTEWEHIPGKIEDMREAGASEEEINEFTTEALEAARHARTQALETLGLDEFFDPPLFEFFE